MWEGQQLMSTPKKKPVKKQKIEKSQKLKTPLSMCSRDSSQIIKILISGICIERKTL